MQKLIRARHVVGTIAQGVKSAPVTPPLFRQHLSLRYASARHQQPQSRKKLVQNASQQTTRAARPPSRPTPWVREEEGPQGVDLKNLPPGYVGAALIGGGIAVYLGQLFFAATKPSAEAVIDPLTSQPDVAARYDEIADSFDSDVGLSEWFMGVNTLRAQLISRSHGHVLEVSCGTGRNLGYYDISLHGKVESVTLVDLSAPMIEVCKKKWEVLSSEMRKAGWFSNPVTLKPELPIRFAAISALGEMPLAPTRDAMPKKYDTIVQTMGLCSTDKPKELLENMVRYLDTSNPDARILLLEHGRSYREWLNGVLDKAARKHAEAHGCWFNRDIGAIVEEVAEKTGMEVSRQRRKHLGTTWLYELKPKVVTEKAALPTSAPPSSNEVKPEAQQSAGGWASWVGLK